MAKGDIVLITFPFTDLTGSKLRPAVILADTTLDLTVCFITTQLQWQETTDVLLMPTSSNGLKKQSLIRTSKIATLDKTLAKGLLGRLTSNELSDLNDKLKSLLRLTWQWHMLTMGFCTSWAEGKSMSICNAIWHQFRLTNIYRLLYLTSILYFQSAAAPGRRNSISQPAQSPVR